MSDHALASPDLFQFAQLQLQPNTAGMLSTAAEQSENQHKLTPLLAQSGRKRKRVDEIKDWEGVLDSPLMSLWIFFSECRYSSPFRISRRIVAIWVSSRAPGSNWRKKQKISSYSELVVKPNFFLILFKKIKFYCLLLQQNMIIFSFLDILTKSSADPPPKYSMIIHNFVPWKQNCK